MASPFADPLTPANPSSDSLASLTQPPWAAAGGAVRDASYTEGTSKKKLPDFWADLAEAANDPSVGFLREPSEVPSNAGEKPWWPLTLAMLALFASMGGNLYMGWIAVDVYRRYLEMADTATTTRTTIRLATGTNGGNGWTRPGGANVRPWKTRASGS